MTSKTVTHAEWLRQFAEFIRDAISPSEKQRLQHCADLIERASVETTAALLDGCRLTYVCGDHAGLRLELYYEKPEQAHAAQCYVEELRRSAVKTNGDVDDTPEHLRKQGYRSGKSP